MAEFTPQQITWLERYMRIISDRQVQQASSQIADIAHPRGFWLIVPEDLTAQTSEYVYTHPVTALTFLYCNGASVSQTTYADLYALWGASKWGADSGGNFVLPDARGRSLWLAGTHAATDVGDNDGVTESSRQPKHDHTSASLTASSHTHASTALTVTGAPAISDSGHGHSGTTVGNIHSAPDGNIVQQDGTFSAYDAGSVGSNTTGITATIGTLDVGGSTDATAPTIGGTAGSGMSGSDAVAHLVLGSLVVRF